MKLKSSPVSACCGLRLQNRLPHSVHEVFQYVQSLAGRFWADFRAVSAFHINMTYKGKKTKSAQVTVRAVAFTEVSCYLKVSLNINSTFLSKVHQAFFSSCFVKTHYWKLCLQQCHEVHNDGWTRNRAWDQLCGRTVLISAQKLTHFDWQLL